MSLKLVGGIRDGETLNSFPRPYPEVICFTDETVDGFHVYSTLGPSDIPSDITQVHQLPAGMEQLIAEAVKKGEMQGYEPVEVLYYEGDVKRTDVLNLWSISNKELAERKARAAVEKTSLQAQECEIKTLYKGEFVLADLVDETVELTVANNVYSRSESFELLDELRAAPEEIRKDIEDE